MNANYNEFGEYFAVPSDVTITISEVKCAAYCTSNLLDENLTLKIIQPAKILATQVTKPSEWESLDDIYKIISLDKVVQVTGPFYIMFELPNVSPAENSNFYFYTSENRPVSLSTFCYKSGSQYTTFSSQYNGYNFSSMIYVKGQIGDGTTKREKLMLK